MQVSDQRLGGDFAAFKSTANIESLFFAEIDPYLFFPHEGFRPVDITIINWLQHFQTKSGISRQYAKYGSRAKAHHSPGSRNSDTQAVFVNIGIEAYLNGFNAASVFQKRGRSCASEAVATGSVHPNAGATCICRISSAVNGINLSSTGIEWNRQLIL